MAGAFNGTAPAGTQTVGDVLEAAVAATGAEAELVWIPDERLQALAVEPWVELPLWIPAAAFPGTWTIGTERARAAGLRARPVAATVADVWAWLRDGGESELDFSATSGTTYYIELAGYQSTGGGVGSVLLYTAPGCG